MKKNAEELKAEGLNITAMSSGGDFKVNSYIGYRGYRRGYRRKVYGYWDDKQQTYIETTI